MTGDPDRCLRDQVPSGGPDGLRGSEEAEGAEHARDRDGDRRGDGEAGS